MSEKSHSTQMIQDEINAASDRLAGNIDLLINHFHPKAVAGRSISQAKDTLDAKTAKIRTFVGEKSAPIKGEIVDEYGNLRDEQLVKLAAGLAVATVGFALFVKLIKRILRRRS